jgi:tripartite ATP-independent transporter DctM subunit
MGWVEVSVLMLGMVVGMMALGLPVAFAFLIADLVGAWLFLGGEVGIRQLVGNAFSSVTSFSLVPVPLFLIMGELFFHTGLAMRVFDALDKCLGQVRGRLSYLTVVGGTMFATLSGSSMANTAMLGGLLVPEMTRRGYKPSMSIGPILGTGGLAMIIPPSSLAVLLASLARIDVGKLLIAGLIPGLLLAALYGLLIFTRLRLDPDAAPHFDVPRVPLAAKLWIIVRDMLPMGLVMVLVVGIILSGVATPTEAAAFGVVGVVVLAAAFRCLTLDAIVKSLRGALRVTVMAFMIIMMSATFSQILAFSGASAGMITWATSADAAPLLILLAMFGALLVLGMFMDQLSMMLLTVPIFMPLADQLGFDLIWFAVIMLLALEISFTTPPFGLLLFVMKGVAPPGTTMAQIYRAALPFMGCALLLVAMLIAFPDIALVLVR